MRRYPFASLLVIAACVPHDGEEEAWLYEPDGVVMPDAVMMPDAGSRPGPTFVAEDVDPDCDAKVADTPTVLFDDSVLIRMPRNVEIIQDSPTTAMTFSANGFEVACGARLRRATFTIAADDPGRSIGEHARGATEWLERMGYVGARDMSWSEPSRDRMRGTARVPAIASAPEVELFVDVGRRFGFVTLLVFEASPEDFPRLLPSLTESAMSLLVVPPDSE